MKNHFPFRLGTTCFILHEDVLTNVHFLKEQVDHIELFTYEDGNIDTHQKPCLIAELLEIAVEYNLTYSIHLPIGLKLGSLDINERKHGVETILRAIDATRPLRPLAWDLHLEQNYRGQTLNIAWQDACISSLEDLKRNGADPSRVGIETLEFDFEPIVPVLDQTGFAVTLDIGHVWFGALNENFYLEKILPRAVSFHLHGFSGHQDHQGLHTIDSAHIKHFLEELYKRSSLEKLPVSIEVFSHDCLERSLTVLAGYKKPSQ